MLLCKICDDKIYFIYKFYKIKSIYPHEQNLLVEMHDYKNNNNINVI